MEVCDQVFIVTDGTSGLGAGTAHMLAEVGDEVVVADLNEAAGTAPARELGGRFAYCNVTFEVDGQAVIKVATSLDTLCRLVNCAGTTTTSRTVGRTGPHPLDQFACVININLTGTFNMIWLAAMTVASNVPGAGDEHGVIISIASVAAFDEQISQVVYTASEGGVVAMMLTIACGLSRDGVRVMTIVPDIFETSILLSMPAEIQDALGRMVPFPPRLGKPPEYAQPARVIIENPTLDSETIHLGGAIRMQPKQVWRSGHEAAGSTIR